MQRQTDRLSHHVSQASLQLVLPRELASNFKLKLSLSPRYITRGRITTLASSLWIIMSEFTAFVKSLLGFIF